MPYLQPPVTPPAQRSPSAASETNIQLLTPSGVAKVNHLKRKASDISDTGAPTTAGHFLEWRLSKIEADLAVLTAMLDDLNSSLSASDSDSRRLDIQSAIAKLDTEKADIEREFTMLVKQKPFLRENLQDTNKAIEDSYVADLFNSWRLASTEGQKTFKKAALSRPKFKEAVAAYPDAVKPVDKTAPKQVWCNVLGWQLNEMVKCAHIVPFCYECKELSYTFGTELSALRDPRNGLYLNRVIEGAFDNGWIAIIPDGSVEKTPTEWKLVVLKDSILNNIVYTAFPTNAITRWRDIDGKPLRFRNDNRPARRYLYFRYVMAHMNAVKEGYADVQKKLPNGRIWASPDKPDGYLRKSVLQVLVQRVGDQPLPFELVRAGTFEDTSPASGRLVEDQTAGIELSYRMKENRKGNLKDDDEDEDEDDDDNEDDDDDEDGDDDADVRGEGEGSETTPSRVR